MNIKQKILFTKEECNSIVWDNKNVATWKKYDRNYQSISIEQNQYTNWIFNKLKEFVEQNTNIKIVKFKKVIHFHKFKENDWFGKHNDNKGERVFAVGVLLNDEFEGGDFNLFLPQKFTLDKKIGNTYIFHVGIYHEITKILSGNRYSLLWFLENENIIIDKKTII